MQREPSVGLVDRGLSRLAAWARAALAAVTCRRGARAASTTPTRPHALAQVGEMLSNLPALLAAVGVEAKGKRSAR